MRHAQVTSRIASARSMIGVQLAQFDVQSIAACAAVSLASFEKRAFASSTLVASTHHSSVRVTIIVAWKVCSLFLVRAVMPLPLMDSEGRIDDSPQCSAALPLTPQEKLLRGYSENGLRPWRHRRMSSSEQY